MDEELEATNYYPLRFDCTRDTSQIGCRGSQRNLSGERHPQSLSIS